MNSIIINMSDINSSIIKVSEKINDDNLYDFIHTSLKQNSIFINKEYKLFYSYLEYTSEYQISYFKCGSKNYTLPFEYFEIDSTATKVFVCDSFFACFINKELYYYQKLEDNLSLYELKIYIEKRLDISVESIEYIEFSKNKKINPNINIKTLKKKIYFHTTVFIFYVCILLSVFGFLYTKEDNSVLSLNTNTINDLYATYDTTVKNIEYKIYVSDDYSSFYKDSLHYDLSLLEFKMKKMNYSLLLSSNNKNNLYAFLKSYEKRLLKSNFQLQQGVHLLYVDIKFN